MGLVLEPPLTRAGSEKVSGRDKGKVKGRGEGKSKGKGPDGAKVQALEGILAVYSYAAGYAPSQEDARLLRAVKAHSVDLTQLPNVSRWARQVASYTAEEVQAWQ